MADEPALFDRIQDTSAAIKRRSAKTPDLAIILGTGLGGLGREIKTDAEIPYGDLPGFMTSTVEAHAGKLLLGTLEGRQVVAMSGRFHRYEGYTMAEVTFPVRVMKALGAGTLVVSNIAGGVNRHFQPGDLMVIEDHINLMGDNPLIGPNDERLGGRFPDLCDCYDPALRRMTYDLGRADGLRIQTGVYAAMTGPSLETAAEYRMLERIGADAIGMSTVPEVLVARHGGMKVLGISVITDVCVADALKPANVAEIIRIAKESEPGLTRLMRKAIAKIGKS